MRAASGDTVDAVTSRHVLSSTVSSDLPIATTADNTVPSLMSSVSVVIGHTKRVSADSDVVPPSEVDRLQRAESASASVGPQISTSSDSSLVLTLSYSPLTLDTVPDDHLPLPKAAANTTIISRSADRLSDREVRSSASACASSADDLTDSSVTERFVVCLCYCWLVLCLHFYFQENNPFLEQQ